MKKGIIILGVLGASTSAVFVRWSDAPPMALVFYRVLFASLLMLPPVLKSRRAELFRLNRRELLLCAAAGAFLGFHFTTYFASLSLTGIASSVVLVDTEIFFVALAMRLLWRDRIGKTAWLGIAASFAGSVLIALAGAGGGSSVLLGDAIALSGAVFMAVYTVLGSVCRRTLSTVTYTFLVYSACAATMLLLLVVSGTPIAGYRPVNYGTALGMAVFCTLLGHSVYSWGLKFVRASFVSTVKLLEPVFASLFGVLLFGEVPGPLVLLGGLAVIAGIVVFSRQSQELPEAEAEAEQLSLSAETPGK